MNTRRTPIRRVEEKVVNDVVPPRGDQVPQGDQVPIVNQKNEAPVAPPDMSNEEVRVPLLTLSRATMTQANRDVGPKVNAIESNMTSRLREFVRMNPPIFLYSIKVGEDPQEFVDGVYKVVSAMGESGIGFISIEEGCSSVVHPMEGQ